jgi:IMPACT family member yigZ
MLDVLAGTGIVDVVAIVTRYFGGTLLGTGGLVRAYSDAVRECLEDALLVTRERLPVWNALLPHADAGRYLAELSAAGFAAEPDYRAEGVRVTVVCDEGERLSSLVSRLSSGSVGVLEGGTRLVERPAGRVRAGRAVIG